jgi:predicted amidohydrolase
VVREVRVAAVAPETSIGEEEYRNAARAVAYAEEAAREGAQLVCFPEAYPGPCTGPMDGGGRLSMAPIAQLQEVAAKHGIFISCGSLEETGIVPDTFYLCHKLISPRGEIVANYRRCQPTPPALNAALYNGRRHLLPGDGPLVVETSIGKLGLIICSEIKVPELARVEMLMGAEVLIGPIGGGSHIGKVDSRGVPLTRAKMAIWKAIALARAAENLMFTIVTANVRHPSAMWGSCICGPLGILAES